LDNGEKEPLNKNMGAIKREKCGLESRFRTFEMIGRRLSVELAIPLWRNAKHPVCKAKINNIERILTGTKGE